MAFICRLIQRHKTAIKRIDFNTCTMHISIRVCSTHTKLFELLYSVSGLKVWVVSSSDCPHRGWLVPSVGLSAVLKVRIRTTRTVNANVS